MFWNRDAQFIIQLVAGRRSCREYFGAPLQLCAGAGGNDDRGVFGLLRFIEDPVECGLRRKLKIVGGRLGAAFGVVADVTIGVKRNDAESDSTGLASTAYIAVS